MRHRRSDIQGDLGQARDFVDRREIDTPRGRRPRPVGAQPEGGRSGDLSLVEQGDRLGDQVYLIERYRAQNGLPLSHPRIAQLDLAYHDIHRGRGLYYLLENRGAVARSPTTWQRSRPSPCRPQTTRARLRGEFIQRAQERRRDFTVDWVHLKLNDQAQRTVLCKDPFRSYDERVQRLIEGM